MKMQRGSRLSIFSINSFVVTELWDLDIFNIEIQYGFLWRTITWICVKGFSLYLYNIIRMLRGSRLSVFRVTGFVNTELWDLDIFYIELQYYILWRTITWIYVKGFSLYLYNIMRMQRGSRLSIFQVTGFVVTELWDLNIFNIEIYGTQ